MIAGVNNPDCFWYRLRGTATAVSDFWPVFGTVAGPRV